MARTNQIQVRRGTATQWSNTNPVLASGEPGFDTTNSLLKVGDGTSAWSSLSSNVGVGDAGLLSIAGLTTASGSYLYATANDVYTTGVITAFGRSLVDDADASTARTTLGLGTLATQSGTFSGTSSGTNTGDQTSVSLGIQPYDAGLTSIAGLTTAADRYIYTTSNDVYTTGAITTFGRSLVDDADASTARTTLGLGTLATQSGTFSGTSSGTNTGDQTAASLSLTIGTYTQAYDAGLTSIAGLTTAADRYIYTTANDVYTTGAITTFGRSLVDDADASTSRTTLGLAIGTDVQAYDAGLLSIAGLTTAADRYIYTTANDVYTTGAITTFGRSLVDDADASTARTTLGLGTLATQSGTFSGTSSGTNTGDQTAASLSLTIGTYTQAYDAGLTSIAALTTASGSYPYATANDVYTTGTSTAYGRSLLASSGVESLITTTLTAGTGIVLSYDSVTDTATINTSGLVIGTNIQAYDAGLQSIAGLTTGSGNYIYATASDVYTTGVITAFGRSLVDDADSSTSRTTLGLVIGTDVLAYNSVLASAFAGGRLTLESGVPISTTDQSAKTTIYYAPYVNSSIGLYDTTNLAWVPYSFTQRSLALGTLSSGYNYDVFMYSNTGTLTLASSIWTSDTARATAISLQDGVYVKTSDKAYRYLGTFRTVTTTTTVDTAAQRLLWNYNNRKYKKVYCYISSIHSYSGAVWRSWNNSTTLGSTRIEFVSGFNEDSISLMYYGSMTYANVSLGLDTTAAVSISSSLIEASTTYSSGASAVGAFTPQIGYHYVQGLEYGASATYSSFTSFAIESSLLC